MFCIGGWKHWTKIYEALCKGVYRLLEELRLCANNFAARWRCMKSWKKQLPEGASYKWSVWAPQVNVLVIFIVVINTGGDSKFSRLRGQNYHNN